jgi:serpin B
MKDLIGPEAASWILLAGILVCTWTVGGAEAGASPAPGVAKLGWALVRLAGNGNAVVSPASVWETLAMTHAGARGETAAEVAGVLGMPDDREAIAAAEQALRRNLLAVKGEGIALDVADRLWAQQGRPLEREFTSLLEGRYKASVGLVDFAAAAQAARIEINRWVGEYTAQKIDELLPPEAVTSLTRLVLTNAAYLKAPWAEPFAKDATRPERFALAAGAAVDVPFMHRSGRLVAGRVGKDREAATVCEIPYAGARVAMVLVVPDALDGVGDVLAGLGADWRTRWSTGDEEAVRLRPVELALPRWTARNPMSLNAALASLGMTRAFQAGAADFSAIDGTRDLYVSAVVHEGFVDVTEEGTEAAAATGVAIGVRSASPRREEPLVVRADRPFAWAIVERDGGALLFAGVVRDPRG